MNEKAMRIVASLLTLVCVIIMFACVDRQEKEYKATAAELMEQIADLRDENGLLNKQLDEREALIQTQADVIDELRRTRKGLEQEQEEQAQKASRSADRPRYNLTDAERDLVERVVMAESGGESYEGQILVCQCILNACEIDGIRPAKVIKKYVYAKGRPKPTDSVRRAVSAVFDRGETVTSEPIVYFYAPKMVRSEFHERQRFAVEEGGHRFFAAR